MISCDNAFSIHVKLHPPDSFSIDGEQMKRLIKQIMTFKIIVAIFDKWTKKLVYVFQNTDRVMITVQLKEITTQIKTT